MDQPDITQLVGLSGPPMSIHVYTDELPILRLLIDAARGEALWLWEPGVALLRELNIRAGAVASLYDQPQPRLRLPLTPDELDHVRQVYDSLSSLTSEIAMSLRAGHLRAQLDTFMTTLDQRVGAAQMRALGAGDAQP